jgi:hypothetical protein
MVCSLKKQGFGWSYFFSITNRPIREQTQVDIISYFSRDGRQPRWRGSQINNLLGQAKRSMPF